MKIGIYTGTFKKNHDGVARATYHIVASLLNRGHEVLVGSPMITPQKRKGLSLYTIFSVPLFFYPAYRFSFPDFSFFRKMDEFQPDFIHIATPDAIGLLLCYYARIKRIPYVFIHHSDIIRVFRYYSLGFLQKTVEFLYRHFYNEAIDVFTPTYQIKREVEALGVKPLSIWSRGIDRNHFHNRFRSEELRKNWKAEGKKVIFYAGRLVWYKDLHIFVDVYNKFKERGHDDVVFVLAGDGPIREELTTKMPDALFLGCLNDQRLSRAFASGDIFLFPSTTETFGQVVQEALSSGLPAVVSDVGGCQEIISLSNAGLVVQAQNAEKFFQACVRLVTNEVLYSNLRNNALEFASRRSWSKINAEIIDKYELYAKAWKKIQARHNNHSAMLN